ncbi:MAG: D-alanine--D-alanine ligase [Patescibacteria group bacterium]
MSYKRVAVVRGGPSEEYEVSLNTGANVLRALSELGYSHKDIVVTKAGDWLETGISRSPEAALQAVDVVFVALHGAYGEDGQIQKILQRNHIPFTGSRAFPSALAFNKALTKEHLKKHKVRMPAHVKVSKSNFTSLKETLHDLEHALGTELFIKPLASGSSHGAKFVPNLQTLSWVLPELLEQYDEVLVEEFIRGREATVGVLQNFRDQDVYVLPVVEIVPPAGEPLFSYENKYSGSTTEICPGRFSYHEKAKLSDAALLAHTVLGCDQYSRSDFIVRNGEVYFLEINTLPGLTSESLLPKAAAAVGLSFNELVRHLVETARV